MESKEPEPETRRASSLDGLDWIPPSMTDEAVELRNNLQQHQDQLLEKKIWSQNAVQEHIDQARAYLKICKIDCLKDLDMLKQVLERLETKYVKAYASVSEVISSDDSDWLTLLALGQKMEVSVITIFPASPPSLLLLVYGCPLPKPLPLPKKQF